MSKVAIVITTFLRDSLLESCIDSINSHAINNEYIILIGDQNPSHIKEMNYNYTPNCIYIPLPYDCGLSTSRNELVKIAKDFKCDYTIISADSIHFTESYDIVKIINIMQKYNMNKVGFQLKNRIPWEFCLNLISKKYFELTLPIGEVPTSGIYYRQVDICKNFFIATTDSLLNVPWDDNLKLMEHEDNAWRYKLQGYKTFVTNFISGRYIDYKPEEYKAMRDRMYSIYRNKLKEKWNIENWINYGPGVKEFIKKYKSCILDK